MVRLEFAIDLKYEIADNPADFVFNIHAARTPWQSVFAEALSWVRRISMRRWRQ